MVRGGSTHILDADYIRALLQEWQKLIQVASFEQQKMLLQLIIQEISVNEVKEIEQITLQLIEELQKELVQTLSEQSLDRVFSMQLVV